MTGFSYVDTTSRRWEYCLCTFHNISMQQLTNFYVQVRSNYFTSWDSCQGKISTLQRASCRALLYSMELMTLKGFPGRIRCIAGDHYGCAGRNCCEEGLQGCQHETKDAVQVSWARILNLGNSCTSNCIRPPFSPWLGSDDALHKQKTAILF